MMQTIMTKTKFLPAEIYPDDIYLVSYPKSGNTWLRFLIGNLLTKNKCDFTNAHLIMPDIHYNPEQCALIPRPRFIKSHAPYVPEYSHVVYLVRDGRDVAVSYYYDSIKFGRIISGTPFEEFITMFHRGELDDYGIWGDHVHSWLDNKKQDILLVRYEDMKRNTLRELSRIIEFAGMALSEEQLNSAITASQFSRMQKLEKEQGDQFEQFLNSNRSLPFIRSGKVGESKEYFSPELSMEFNKIQGDALSLLGYLEASTKILDEEESIGSNRDDKTDNSSIQIYSPSVIQDSAKIPKVETWLSNDLQCDSFEAAYQKIRSPKTKFSVRDPNHFTNHRLKQLGFIVEEYQIDIDNFQNFLKAVHYEETYPDFSTGNLPEKALEHYLAAKLLQLSPSDTYVNVMTAGSPAPKIYSDLFGVRSLIHEASSDSYFLENENQLGSSPALLPLPNGSVDKLALHCGFEHLEGDEDIQFIKKVSQVLKPGGKACIVPLYLSNNYGIITDPEVAVQEGTTFEDGVMVYCMRGWNNRFGRFYDPEHLFERVLKNIDGLTLKIIHIVNAKQVDPTCYVEYAMLLEKDSEKVNPSLTEEYIKLADEKVAAGDLDRAIDLLFECAGLHPDAAEVYQLLAILMIQKQTYQSARTMLEKAISLKPDDAQLYNQLGTVCYLAGDNAASKAAYEKALSIDPNMEDVKANLFELSRILPVQKDNIQMENELNSLLDQLNKHIAVSRALTDNLVSMAKRVEKMLGHPEKPEESQSQESGVDNMVKFGKGFHQDEGGFRWVAAEGQMLLSSLSQFDSIEIDFDLTCANANCYQQFPFETRVFVSHEERACLVFDADEQTRSVKLNIPTNKQDDKVIIISSQSFIPAQLGGGSPDMRELSVQFSHLNILAVLKEAQVNESAKVKLSALQQEQERNREEVNWWKHFIFKHFSPDRETSEKLFLDRFRIECTKRWNYICDPLGFDANKFHESALLDIGNGPCGLLNFVPGNIKVGIDPNNQMYRANEILYNIENSVRYITCPAEKLPLPDAYFEFISCVNVLDHVNDPQIVLDEIIRVLKPGGFFFLSVDTRREEETSLVHPHAFDGGTFIEMAKPLVCLHSRNDQPCYDDNPVNKRFDGWFQKN